MKEGRKEGKKEGRKKGRKEGRKEEKKEKVRKDLHPAPPPYFTLLNETVLHLSSVDE